MYSIQLLNKISQRGLRQLHGDRFSVSDTCENPDGILVRSAAMHGRELPASLKAIARAGAGVNNIPVDECTERGIVVFNTPGANANSVKELVIAGLLLSSRRIFPAMTWVQSLSTGGHDIAKTVEQEKSRFTGPEILGKKLGVVGLGAIGVMVANAAVGLEMAVVGYDPFISVESAWGMSRSVERATSLDSLLSQCDYISLHVPLNGDTKGMVNAALLGTAKPGARLLNFARGELVVHADVIAALNNGHLESYVTDFPEAELLGHDRVVAIPHLGASTPEAEENCAEMAARQLGDYLGTGNITNSVNFPNCRLEFGRHARLIVANKNIPNMVGQITTILARSGCNISDMINRGRGDIAYNIIDLQGTVSEATQAEIAAIAGVFMTRVITP